MVETNGSLAEQLQEIFGDDEAKIPHSVSNRLILAAVREERKERRSDISAIREYHKAQEATIEKVDKNEANIKANTDTIGGAKKLFFWGGGILGAEIIALFFLLVKEYVIQ